MYVKKSCRRIYMLKHGVSVYVVEAVLLRKCFIHETAPELLNVRPSLVELPTDSHCDCSLFCENRRPRREKRPAKYLPSSALGKKREAPEPL